MKQALIIQGGWTGHEPQLVAEFFGTALEGEGFSVEIADTLSVLDDAKSLTHYDLISPCWTMGKMSPEQSANLRGAINAGCGLGGCHGGMGDAFRGDIDYEWMVGGHFVGHPFVGEYTVSVRDRTHPAMSDLPDSFSYNSEQYYLMIDPCIEVLADTVYQIAGCSVTMPVVWTKPWGQGRIFYSALGHKPKEFEEYPAVARMTVEGLKWAARTKP